LEKIYIAPDFSAHSGVSAYARKFYEHVLEPEGFQCLHFASLADFEKWQRGRAREQHFHIEIAVGTHAERSILWALLHRGATVDITLHDPPFIAFPYYRNSNRWLNQASKLAQISLPQRLFGLARVRRIRRIFVLSLAGCARTLAVYPGAAVRLLPFICAGRPLLAPREEQGLAYTGFIGKNKGLDYALEIHRALLTEFPDLVFKVVGEPADRITSAYFKTLQRRYRDNVEYLGYVDDETLTRLLCAGYVVLLPTRDYRTICPASSNILNALTLGSLVVSTAANANSEFIEDGRNGRLLRNVLAEDIAMIAGLLRDRGARSRMIAEAQGRLARENSPQRVREALAT
jgi:glycosyltransferase involved in cell wall biosynthesis